MTTEKEKHLSKKNRNLTFGNKAPTKPNINGNPKEDIVLEITDLRQIKRYDYNQSFKVDIIFSDQNIWYKGLILKPFRAPAGRNHLTRKRQN